MMKLAENLKLYKEGTNGYVGFGPLGLVNGSDNAKTVFATFISSAVGLITIIGVIWLIFIITTVAI